MGVSKIPLSFSLFLYNKSLSQVVFTSQLFSFFKIDFAVLEPLYFHINLKTSLYTKACQDFAHFDNLDEHHP